MGSTLRRLAAASVVGLVAVFVLAPPASAGTGGAPTSPGACTFEVTGTFPNLTVHGTTPAADVQVTAYFQADGSATQSVIGTTHLTNGGPWSFAFTAPSPGNVSANYTYGNKNAYTTGCIGPGGITVIHVGAEEAARNLAFTGSSHTTTYVLIGLAALALGTVLVIGARRRSRVDA